jgi:alanyl-tRNA synthetase
MTDDELDQVASFVNREIRANAPLEERRAIPVAVAKNMGALAFFGEKYGDLVRVVKFGDSIELCGGTHAGATGQIGYFKILTESSIAAGVRRIEACTGVKAEEYIHNHFAMIKDLLQMFKSNRGLLENVRAVLDENEGLKKEIEKFENEGVKLLKERLKADNQQINGVHLITHHLMLSPAQVKNLAFQLKGELNPLALVLGGIYNDKPHLSVMLSEDLVAQTGLHAGTIVREAAKEIRGGGGGQPFFATAGGSLPSGIDDAIAKAREAILLKIKKS